MIFPALGCTFAIFGFGLEECFQCTLLSCFRNVAMNPALITRDNLVQKIGFPLKPCDPLLASHGSMRHLFLMQHSCNSLCCNYSVAQIITNLVFN